MAATTRTAHHHTRDLSAQLGSLLHILIPHLNALRKEVVALRSRAELWSTIRRTRTLSTHAFFAHFAQTPEVPTPPVPIRDMASQQRLSLLNAQTATSSPRPSRLENTLKTGHSKSAYRVYRGLSYKRSRNLRLRKTRTLHGHNVLNPHSSRTPEKAKSQ